MTYDEAVKASVEAIKYGTGLDYRLVREVREGLIKIVLQAVGYQQLADDLGQARADVLKLRDAMNRCGEEGGCRCDFQPLLDTEHYEVKS